MNKLMNLFVAFVLFLLAAPALAAGCDSVGGDYTAAQQAAMIAACEAAKSTAVELPNPAEVSEWGTIAQEFAKALGIAAREIGVSVNEFLDSPAGYITVAVIFWTTLGGSIAKYALIAACWLFGIWLIKYIWTVRWDQVEYKNVFGNVRSKSVRVFYNWDNADDSQVVCVGIVIFAMFISTLMIVVNL